MYFFARVCVWSVFEIWGCGYRALAGRVLINMLIKLCKHIKGRVKTWNVAITTKKMLQTSSPTWSEAGLYDTAAKESSKFNYIIKLSKKTIINIWLRKNPTMAVCLTSSCVRQGVNSLSSGRSVKALPDWLGLETEGIHCPISTFLMNIEEYFPGSGWMARWLHSKPVYRRVDSLRTCDRYTKQWGKEATDPNDWLEL